MQHPGRPGPHRLRRTRLHRHLEPLTRSGAAACVHRHPRQRPPIARRRHDTTPNTVDAPHADTVIVPRSSALTSIAYRTVSHDVHTPATSTATPTAPATTVLATAAAPVRTLADPPGTAPSDHGARTASGMAAILGHNRHHGQPRTTVRQSLTRLSHSRRCTCSAPAPNPPRSTPPPRPPPDPRSNPTPCAPRPKSPSTRTPPPASAPAAARSRTAPGDTPHPATS